QGLQGLPQGVPTVSDNHQAELLARWLSESSRGEPAPEGLDADAVEAILALRPDLAPPARVDIRDILDAVEDGPFAASTDGEVAALADWLGGGDLDDTSDLVGSDIQETVFALRPDLAPAPRVDMDDIFGAVTEGPFAEPAEPIAEIAPVVSLADVREQRASRRRWWAPVGAIAAAAAALLMINPAVMNLPAPTQDLSIERSMDQSGAAVADPAPAASAASVVEPMDSRLAEARKDAVSTGDAAHSGLNGAEGLSGGEVQQAPLSAATEDAAPEPEPVEELEEDLSRGGMSAPEPVVAKPESAPTEPARETTRALESLGYVSEPVPDSAGGFGTAGLVAGDEDAADDDLSVDRFEDAPQLDMVTAEARDYNEVEGENRRFKERNGLVRPRVGRNQDAPAAAEAPAAPEEQAAEIGTRASVVDESVSLADTNDLPGLGEAAMLDRLRGSANSLKPVPNMSVKYPDLAAAYAAADAEWNAGRMDVAIGLLAPFAVHPDPDVVLDVTWQHANMRYRTGEIPSALQVIEGGLRVSGGDGLLRSRLYALQGTLLERRGQPEEAIQAYRKAIEVR
ncbi:MAG: hypothetical protein ACI8RZ_006205, partial [Myxococcota bacterium]